VNLPEKAQNVNDLRQHLIDVWVGLEQSVIDNMELTSACIRATGHSLTVMEISQNIINCYNLGNIFC